MSLNTKKIRSNFKILSNKKNTIFFDNACTTLTPNIVIDEIVKYYEEESSCHGRAVHNHAKNLNRKIHKARKTIANFLNVKNENEIIFTKNTTESINILANSLNFYKGDVVCTTNMEHNSNMLPWQFLKQKGDIDYIQFELSEEFEFNTYKFKSFAKENKIKLLSIFHTSNITGVELPILEISKICKELNILLHVDAAQAIATKEIDVQKLGIDLLSFSGHKAFGPTGIGVLYGKMEILEKLRPFIVGGETAIDTTFDTCVLAKIPQRFEAGILNYSAILGLSKSLEFIKQFKNKDIQSHIANLNEKLSNFITQDPNYHLIGPPDSIKRSGIINFYHSRIKSEELCLLLDQNKGILTRSGVHCGHAWYHLKGETPSLRVSLAMYNTEQEIEELIKVLKHISTYY